MENLLVYIVLMIPLSCVLLFVYYLIKDIRAYFKHRRTVEIRRLRVVYQLEQIDQHGTGDSTEAWTKYRLEKELETLN